MREMWPVELGLEEGKKKIEELHQNVTRLTNSDGQNGDCMHTLTSWLQITHT